jgi:hypothetical protein
MLTKRFRCSCFCPNTHIHNIRTYISEITDLTRIQKLLLERRYTQILDQYERRTLLYSWIYNVMRAILVVGGILVPALISIQHITDVVYWVTLIFSILIGVCTSVIAAFKIDKRYYILHTTLEIMDSELHQFFGLTGKYAKTGQNKPYATHHSHIQRLFYSLEKLRLSQVQQEYVQFFGPLARDTDVRVATDVSRSTPPDSPMTAAITALGPPPETLDSPIQNTTEDFRRGKLHLQLQPRLHKLHRLHRRYTHSESPKSGATLVAAAVAAAAASTAVVTQPPPPIISTITHTMTQLPLSSARMFRSVSIMDRNNKTDYDNNSVGSGSSGSNGSDLPHVV